MSEKIWGGKINKIVKQRCHPHQKFFQGKLITIIVFNPPSDEINQRLLSQYEAAVTSTNQKVKTFEFLGCEVNRVELPASTQPLEFEQILNTASNQSNSIGIIVQNPLPNRYLRYKLNLIPNKLDIDGVKPSNSSNKVSATSEAVCRLVESFTTDKDTVAVVGSMGFVGKGIVKWLRAKQIDVVELDAAKGDALQEIKQRVLNANLVVSATGVANLITRDFLRPEHKLVVDTGFIPQAGGGQPLGDVAKDAYDIPQRMTPVPGGVGPTQMAVLLERIMKMAQIEIKPWDYHRDIIPLIESERAEREELRNNVKAEPTPTPQIESLPPVEQSMASIVAPIVNDFLRVKNSEQYQGKIYNAAWKNNVLILSSANGSTLLEAQKVNGQWQSKPDKLTSQDVEFFQGLKPKIAEELAEKESIQQGFRQEYEQLRRQVRSNPNYRNESPEKIDMRVAMLVINDAENSGTDSAERVFGVLSQSDTVLDFKKSLQKSDYLRTANEYVNHKFKSAVQARKNLGLKRQQGFGLSP